MNIANEAFPDVNQRSARRRSLLAACSAHAVHDGLTDLIYVPSHVMVEPVRRLGKAPRSACGPCC